MERPAWALFILLSLSSHAATVQNTATATYNGLALDVTAATVNFNVGGGAVTSALAEISPNTAFVSSVTKFSYDALPSINVGDTGVDRVNITAPAGYSGLAVTGVLVGGGAQVSNCPAPGAGQYCAAVSGSTVTVTLGAKIMASGTNINILFDAIAPGAIGSGDFTSTLDDTTTPVPAQTAFVGNADGDAADANSLTVAVILSDLSGSTLTAAPIMVISDGSAASTLTATLRNAAGTAISGKTVVFSTDRGAVDAVTQPAGPSDAGGVAIGTVRSTSPGVSTITATDTTDGIALSTQATVYFTQGLVLDITKTANKKEAVVGDIVTYQLAIKNTTTKDVVLVTLDDKIPPDFKYMKGTARLNGVPIPDPAGNRPLEFNLGTVPAWVDSNGNGQVDPQEPGYLSLSYQLVIGSGAAPGDYVNSAWARDVCAVCLISNTSQETVEVVLDPLFDLGTIIGKVFEDKNGDGWQDDDEPGIGGAMVVLDEGTYVLTDAHGRYHFPAIRPGERLLKININSLPSGTTLTTDETRIASVTPGLLAKVNFGLKSSVTRSTIGRAGEAGLLIIGREKVGPVQLLGSVEMQSLLINGTEARMPSADAWLFAGDFVSEALNYTGRKLESSMSFHLSARDPSQIRDWKLEIMEQDGQVLQTFTGAGAPPSVLPWDGTMGGDKLLKGGRLYDYQLTVSYVDGNGATSPRRLIGVNKKSVIALNLTGSAFASDSALLSSNAKALLADVAKTLREFPGEKVIIEGNADSTGTKERNIELSQQRATAAAAYLIDEEGIPRERLDIRWYGSARPLASNETPEGRMLNRRVEISGEVSDIVVAKRISRYHGKPNLIINGETIELDQLGRFWLSKDPRELEEISVEMVNRAGRSSRARFVSRKPLLLGETGEVRLPNQGAGENYRIIPSSGHGRKEGDEVGMYMLEGVTTPSSEITFDGAAAAVDADGKFQHELKLTAGTTSHTLIMRDPSGDTRVSTFTVTVKDRDQQGRPMYLVDPIPRLDIDVPSADAKFHGSTYTLSGVTDAGNSVVINGVPAKVEADGSFTATMALAKGTNHIQVRATNPEGFVGSIDYDVESSEGKLFFMALADGKFSQLKGKGYVEGAGMRSNSEFYSEGRIAYYLKGEVRGKYLITSALDTGSNELGNLFKDLNDDGSKKLLANLDPDKYYPVYGDASTIVYDTQSQGKFYLAVDSDTIHGLIGNYPLNLSDTELSAYQRTLYGGHFSYQSLSRSQYGKPDTTVELFTSQAAQGHVRNELRGTGGSLYYLSHRDITEGSEQVTLVIRDKNTGLTLSRIPQTQNIDYTIKYPEGRLFFNRPISSTAGTNTVIAQNLLAGNPVFIQVDYEYRADAFEKTASGARLRQQVGDHLSIGATYVDDELGTGKYQLQGVDSEIRLGDKTRVVVEVAQSTGSDGQVLSSDDGGLTFSSTVLTGTEQGEARKLAVEMDVGEWLGKPDRLQAGAYIKELDPGFIANGNSSDQGARKTGANVTLHATAADTARIGVDLDEATGPVAAGAIGSTSRSTVQWNHKQDRWDVTGEFQSSATQDGAGATIDNSAYGAARLNSKITDKLTGHAEHQATLEGVANDRTKLGVDYQALPDLTIMASGTSGSQGNAAEAGAAYTPGKNKLYLTERLNEDSTGKSSSTIVGGATPLGRDGRFYTEYQWEQADAGDRNLSVTGAEQNWMIEEGLKLTLSGELADISAKAGKTTRTALAFGVSYSGAGGIKASNRNEIRHESGITNREQFLTSNTLEIKLNPDYTVLGKLRYAKTHNSDLNQTEAEFSEQSIGIAYRPIAHDRFNGLGRYTHLSDMRPLALSGVQAVTTGMDVFSVEWSYDITRRLEWVEKLAARYKTEATGDLPELRTQTYLTIHRMNLRLPKDFGVGAEYRTLSQKQANDQRMGWLTELTWDANKHLRLGAGYNFTDFSDNEFSTNDYSVEGWFVRMQGKY